MSGIRKHLMQMAELLADFAKNHSSVGGQGPSHAGFANQDVSAKHPMPQKWSGLEHCSISDNTFGYGSNVDGSEAEPEMLANFEAFDPQAQEIV